MVNAFQQTPSYQLNLILWMSWFSPSYDIVGIRPIFKEYGFTLHSIERTFALPQKKRLLFSQSNMQVNKNTDPDVLLKHETKPLLLPIECKSSSFGSESSNTKQAYALLAINGPDMADQIGFPKIEEWEANLCYAVGDGKHSLMDNTLMNLSKDLRDINLEPNRCSSLGIETNNTGIYINLERLTGDANNSRVMVKSGNPEIIFLIPADLDVNLDDHDLEIRALEERLRSAFIECVMEKIAKSDFTVSEDEIMRRTIEVWELWNKRQAKKGLLRSAIRPYLSKIVNELQKINTVSSEEDENQAISQLKVKISNREIIFENVSRSQRKEIMDYLTSTKFKDGEITLSQNMKQKGFGDIPDVEGW